MNFIKFNKKYDKNEIKKRRGDNQMKKIEMDMEHINASGLNERPCVYLPMSYFKSYFPAYLSRNELSVDGNEIKNALLEKYEEFKSLFSEFFVYKYTKRGFEIVKKFK